MDLDNPNGLGYSAIMDKDEPTKVIEATYLAPTFRIPEPSDPSGQERYRCGVSYRRRAGLSLVVGSDYRNVRRPE